MSDEGGNVEDNGGVSPPVSQTDCEDDNETCDRRDGGIYPGGGGARSSGLIPRTGVHSDTAGAHSSTSGMLAHI